MNGRMLAPALLGILLLYANLGSVLGDQPYTLPLLGGRWVSRVITVQIPTSPEVLRNATVSALESWNNAQLWFVQTYYPGTPTYTFTQSSNGAAVMVQFLDMTNYTNLGETQLTPWPLSGKVIEGATVKLPTSFNGANFSSPIYFSWLTALAVHEFGHVLGLGHPAIPDIMNGTVHSFFISTLDLYAVHVLADGQVPDSVTLPDNVPYMTVQDSTIPEFSGNFLPVILFVIVLPSLVLTVRKRNHVLYRSRRGRFH